MSNSWWFLYQRKGGEEDWTVALAAERATVTRDIKPAFVTVLDLSLIPDDHDWSKVKYRGPLYFDFDADGDLELACSQFKVFLGKLDDDYGFDLTQAKLFASGGKGFHVEIPETCFMSKVPPAGVTWLPYIYKTVADALVVDTMDMRVYTGKRGRMWRTPGVQRENGNYKIQLSLADALEMTPESYLELVKSPGQQFVVAPPSLNTKLAMLFERSREKIVQHMRGRKKRVEKANAFLDPWKKAGRIPPTIQALMNGENVQPNAGFNRIAMQLGIYATSVGMDLNEFLNACRGLCESYTGDSQRYGSFAKRQEQLADQYRYMQDSDLYEFDTAPIIKLLVNRDGASDLGVIDSGESQESKSDDSQEGGEEVPGEDRHKGVRKGLVMNPTGMYVSRGDNTDSLCRGTLESIVELIDGVTHDFRGFEFDIKVNGKKVKSATLAPTDFTSSLKLKNFFAEHALVFQGGDPEALALMDIMQKRTNGAKTYSYPREGLFVLPNPDDLSAPGVNCYLTQNYFESNISKVGSSDFRLRYKAATVASSYNLDIQDAPDLGEEHFQAVTDLLNFSRPEVVADLVGWMVAAHYRFFYHLLWKQFPLLQVYGEAGSGKSQTVQMLAHMHWFKSTIPVRTAASCTGYVMDGHVSSSTSAPLIIDEYKPSELRSIRGRYEKFKDVLKASYNMMDVGERGTIIKGPGGGNLIIKSQATAPIIFIGEAVEQETAIYERSVNVNFSKGYHNPERTAAFERLQRDPTALSAIGRIMMKMGVAMNPEDARTELMTIREQIEANLPKGEGAIRLSPRPLFNRAVVVQGLCTLQRSLHKVFGRHFDPLIESMVSYKVVEAARDDARSMATHGMSEMSKVFNRISIMSRDTSAPWELRRNQDYIVGEGWIEMRVERAYDLYRRWCVAHSERALFDNLDTWLYALNAYSPVMDRVCANSELREQSEGDKIVRFDLGLLRREGVGNFRT